MKGKGAIRWIGLFVAAICLLAVLIGKLAGWGDAGVDGVGHGKGEPSGGTSGLHKIRIVLTAYPHAGHAFLFAAEANGFLHAQGFVLEPVVAESAAEALRMVDEGEADLALVSQPDVLLARNAGRAVVSIAAIVREPLVYLIVPQDSPIHHPAHLAGKTVALSSDSPIHEAMLATMLDSVRGDKPEVSRVTLDDRPAAMLLAGRADALLGPSILAGKQAIEAENMAVRVIEPMLYGVPHYYETVLAAGEHSVESDHETLGRIWAALVQGYEFVAENPDEAATLLLQAGVFDDKPGRSLTRESLRMPLPFMRTGSEPFGSQDRQVWKETEKWLTDLDMIDFMLDADDAFVDLAAESAE